MSIRGPGWANYVRKRVIERVQRFIEADIKMGFRGRIHHIWIHPSNASFLGLGLGYHKHEFVINGSKEVFCIMVCHERPQSLAPESKDYLKASVDIDGWVVGERTHEELANRPAEFKGPLDLRPEAA